jgi:hypothetical protein
VKVLPEGLDPTIRVKSDWVIGIEYKLEEIKWKIDQSLWLMGLIARVKFSTGIGNGKWKYIPRYS